MLIALGIVLFILGLLFSIWFHELGHFTAARKFNMRVSQFMVGFGKTVWSRRIGETEHGIKAIPLGGYIRIIGMIPPVGHRTSKQKQRNGPIARLVSDVRDASLSELQPGDDTRAFYTKPWWQRAIVMFAGPFQNLILAFVFFAIVLCVIGVHTPSLTVSTVSQCVIPGNSAVTDCATPIDSKGKECIAGQANCALPPASPAAEAGLKPGDKLISVNGQAAGSWDDVRAKIRVSAKQELNIVVDRGGNKLTLAVTPMPNTIASDSDPKKFVTVGYVGFSPTTPLVTQSVADVPSTIWTYASTTAQRLVQIPGRVPQLIQATFAGAQRDPNGPVGLVGVGRISGEIFNLPEPVIDKIAYLLSLLASLNLVLFLFNLVPLYPLDGGHIAGALYEGARNGIYRIRGLPRPGPFDVARIMPLAYVVAAVFILFSGLLVIADIVNPITLS